MYRLLLANIILKHRADLPCSDISLWQSSACCSRVNPLFTLVWAAGSGQEPSGRARKSITKQKDKQEAHGEDKPKEQAEKKHVALGRRQLAQIINCVVILLLSFSVLS